MRNCILICFCIRLFYFTVHYHTSARQGKSFYPWLNFFCSFVCLCTTSHSFYQQWHVSLIFLIILIFFLVRYNFKLFCMVSPWKCQCDWKWGYDVAFKLNTRYLLILILMYSWLTINCCTCIIYLTTFYHCFNSSFCQSIEYQDAHANLLTESTVTLNSQCNFTPVGKELSIG